MKWMRQRSIDFSNGMSGESWCRALFIQRPIKRNRGSSSKTLPHWLKKLFSQETQKTSGPSSKWLKMKPVMPRISTIRSSWAPKHIRPLTPRQVIREYTYVYVVVAPKEGKMASLILPSADTSMMNLFLTTCKSHFFQVFSGDTGRSSRMAQLQRSGHSRKHSFDSSTCLQS